MKILIIGAGVGGLATYKFLTKLLHTPVTQLQQTESAPVTIKIYESHLPPTATASATPHPSHPPSRTTTTTTTIGGGLGLAPNGLRVLDSLSPDLARKIIGQGFYSGARFTFRNASGKTLGRFDGGSEEMYGFGNLMTSRQGVHDAVGEGVEVEYGRRVVEVKELEGGVGVEVVFEDGGSEEADFVIGADGVRSVVRRDVLGEGYEAEYQGLTGVGSFLPTSLLPPEFISTLTRDPIVMTFGPCGFFGYSPCTPDSSTLMWWSTFPLPSRPMKQTPPPPADEIESVLLERHGSWKSPIDHGDYKFFRELIRIACDPERAEDILVLPAYVVPILPRFASESGRIVLLGDAAHAMPPDSGQGVSMALEDAQTLAILISELLFSDHHNHGRNLENDSEVFKVVARRYTSLRKPRTDAVIAAAKTMGDQKRELGWWGECLRDLVLRIVCMLPDGWKGLERLRGYVVESEVGKVLETPGVEQHRKGRRRRDELTASYMRARKLRVGPEGTDVLLRLP